MTNNPLLQRDYQSISSWAKQNELLALGLSAQAGGGKGISAEISGIKEDQLGKPQLIHQKIAIDPKEDAIVFLKLIHEVAKFNLENQMTKAFDTPVNVSWAAPHASEVDKKDAGFYHHIDETPENGYVFRSNIRFGGIANNSDERKNAISDIPFDLKRSLALYLPIEYNFRNTEGKTSPRLKISGEKGRWTYSTQGKAAVKTNWMNDGNMVALSTASKEANSISVHCVQGGGGNANIVVKDSQGKIEAVINTEAFSKALTTLPQKLKERTLLIHGQRESDQIEKWTAGGQAGDRNGVKGSVHHLRALKRQADRGNEDAVNQLVKIFQELGLQQKAALKSKIFTSSDSDINTAAATDLNRWVSETAKADDQLAKALEADLLKLTLATVKQELDKVRAKYPNHDFVQFTYHGGSIKGKLEKTGLSPEQSTDLVTTMLRESNNPGYLGEYRVEGYDPHMDGARRLTEDSLRENFKALSRPMIIDQSAQS